MCKMHGLMWLLVQMAIKQYIYHLTESGRLLLYSQAVQAYQVVEYHNHQSLKSSACQSEDHKTTSLLSQKIKNIKHTDPHAHI